MRTLALASLAAAVLGFAGCGPAPADDGTDKGTDTVESASTGNGAPSGAHYNLNIIGVPKGKTADMSGNNGRRIFVPLWGKSSIYLKEGDFQVLDANGTDGRAEFQLPAPDPENDGITSYSVFVRALGTPGGHANLSSCMTEMNTGDTYCSADWGMGYTIEVKDGARKFTNVSKYLLYVYADLTDDGVDNPQRYPLFSDDMMEYFWDYDNYGLKLAQLRFYDVSTDVGSWP